MHKDNDPKALSLRRENEKDVEVHLCSSVSIWGFGSLWFATCGFRAQRAMGMI